MSASRPGPSSPGKGGAKIKTMSAPRADGDRELLRAFRERVRIRIASALEQEREEAEERRDRVVPSVRKAVSEARRDEMCGRAWLFGSYAWGQPTRRSDVDLLAEDCPDPEVLASVVGRLTATDVHVVRSERAPESLRVRAYREGMPL